MQSIPKVLKIPSVIILLFLCLGAVFGGVTLIIDPSGELIGLPLKALNGTPFSDFLIPGIILLIMNGGLSLGITILVIRNHRFSWQLITLQGLVLFGWLTAEILMGIYDPFFHIMFYIVTALLLVLGLVTRSWKNRT